MKLTQNSFINYINQTNNLFRISNIRNYRLICKIINLKSNLSAVNFGHYRNFNITFKELQKYFSYNRLLPIFKDKNDLLNNKLNCKLTEISPQGNPIFKNSVANIETVDLNTKVKSLILLKKAFLSKKIVNGRILKKTSGGFIVAILGFFAFLPNSHSFVKIKKKRKFRIHRAKTKKFYSVVPFTILSIRCLQVKSKSGIKADLNYKLNIVVSFCEGIKNFTNFTRKIIVKKLIRIYRIIKLKNLNKLNKNKLKKSYILYKKYT